VNFDELQQQNERHRSKLKKCTAPMANVIRSQTAVAVDTVNFTEHRLTKATV
jgi:hypothetical protein